MPAPVPTAAARRSRPGFEPSMAVPRSATRPVAAPAAPNPGAFIQTPPSPTDAPVSRIVPTGTPSTPRPVGRAIVARPGLGRPMPIAPSEPPPLVESDEPEPPPPEDFAPPPPVVETEVDDSPPPRSYPDEFVPKPLPTISGDMTTAERARAQRLAVLAQIIGTPQGRDFLERAATYDDPCWQGLSDAWCNDIPF